jgi:hypothetical protein
LAEAENILGVLAKNICFIKAEITARCAAAIRSLAPSSTEKPGKDVVE